MALIESFFNLKILKHIGSGSYGRVLEAKDIITDHKVALKFIKKKKNHVSKFLINEYKIQSLLEHKNICKLYKIIDCPNDLVLVLELAEGIDLCSYLKKNGKLTENTAKRIFGQLVSALNYMHSNSIVHRDMKLDNIVISANCDVKICDFGLSSFYNNKTLLDDFCGTPQYAPPEIMNGTPYIGPEVDIWSLGVVLYAITHGYLPYPQKNIKEIRENIKSGQLKFDRNLSSELKNLINQLIEPDKNKRIKMNELIIHPWLQKIYVKSKFDIVFINLQIVEKLIELGFDEENIFELLMNRNSFEFIVYTLIRDKMDVGYDLKLLCSPQKNNLYNVIDLGFINNNQRITDHRLQIEKYNIMKDIKVKKKGICSFLYFFSNEKYFYIRRIINQPIEKTKKILVNYMEKANLKYVDNDGKYLILCRKYSLTLKIDLYRHFYENTLSIFILKRGEKEDFAKFILNFVIEIDKSIIL